MILLKAISLLIVGFTILVLSGDALVRAAVSIAVKLKVKPMVIGLTIIAAGTSAPELMTSVLASLKNAPDIALGNVVGSNIFNLLGIIGIACLIRPNYIDPILSRFEIPALILFTILLIVCASNLIITQFEGLLFLFALALFLWLTIRRAKQHSSPKQESNEELDEVLKNWIYDSIFLIGGIGGLILGANIALEGGVTLGQLAGLSDRIIGITIISVGTGLPELAASSVAAFRGHNDIAISNVIGSNIMNILLVIGAATSIHPIKVDPNILSVDSLWMLAATLMLLPTIYFSKKTFGRKTGAIYLAGYFAYLTFLLNSVL